MAEDLDSRTIIYSVHGQAMSKVGMHKEIPQDGGFPFTPFKVFFIPEKGYYSVDNK